MQAKFVVFCRLHFGKNKQKRRLVFHPPHYSFPRPRQAMGATPAALCGTAGGYLHRCPHHRAGARTNLLMQSKRRRQCRGLRKMHGEGGGGCCRFCANVKIEAGNMAAARSRWREELINRRSTVRCEFTTAHRAPPCPASVGIRRQRGAHTILHRMQDLQQRLKILVPRPALDHIIKFADFI